MSQMISRRTNSFELHAQRDASLGWAGDLALALPRALLRMGRRAWRANADERLLQDLSDHQLRDIGIRREHIPHVVRNGWDI